MEKRPSRDRPDAAHWQRVADLSSRAARRARKKSGAGTATAFVTLIHRKVAYLPDKPVDNSAGPDMVPASNDDRRQTPGMHKKRPNAELTKNRDVFTILFIYPVKRKE
ncbi:hypothetical protein IPE29_004106 [Salmonella enterica subsp. diarizonae serovar Rough:-:-]|nr:hypothetical protein [Salmonella enterica]EGO1766470.1 hypothetical protein [Salmonella enterica subsp. diarizonae serovar Rough:-:-]EHC1183780.1 hypothetical protein [Salmonella enterica]EHC1193192.1 hypothetical protein [Salmonella enterica]EIS5513337.1 hypothetical protein [Salmonella enterica]